ncbi:MAG: enoyl-CoA hydratase/isomerase family protein [Candidatus Zixiibacteriota bacterium]|nr:MAG: enoyl-CoA hydratase/isomerase family protein [candidate division Zixibacteria bacterium]
MVNGSHTKAFDFQSEALDSYIDSGVGVLHFKDKVFEMSVDFSLQSMLNERIKIASESPDIKVLLMKCNRSILGEEKNDQYWRSIIGLCDETDSHDFYGITDPAMAVARVDSMLNQIIITMLRFNKFVISALQGSVVTDFLGAILVADYRIASEDTVFSFPHIRYGLPPRGGLGYILPKYVGLSKAKEILFNGEPLPATEANRLGLVDEVVKNDEFEDKSLEIAGRYTRIPSDVLASTKKLLGFNIKELEEFFKLESELTNIYQIHLPSDS